MLCRCKEGRGGGLNTVYLRLDAAIEYCRELWAKRRSRIAAALKHPGCPLNHWSCSQTANSSTGPCLLRSKVFLHWLTSNFTWVLKQSLIFSIFRSFFVVHLLLCYTFTIAYISPYGLGLNINEVAALKQPRRLIEEILPVAITPAAPVVPPWIVLDRRRCGLRDQSNLKHVRVGRPTRSAEVVSIFNRSSSKELRKTNKQTKTTTSKNGDA